MTVSELVAELLKHDQSLEVTITDGYECITYRPKTAVVEEFEEDDGSFTVDIAIGGSRI